MSWPASLFVGVLTALIGAFSAGAWALCYAEWSRMPNREGGQAYFVAFIGLLGLLVGFIVGLVTARMMAAGVAPSFMKTLGASAGICVGAATFATLVAWFGADFPTTRNGNPIIFHAEIRCPAGFELPVETKAESWYARVNTPSRPNACYGSLRPSDARQEDGRWIIPGSFVLDTSVREKLVTAHLDEMSAYFVLTFSSKPEPQLFSWSSWIKSTPVVNQVALKENEVYQLRFQLEEKVPVPEVATVEPTEAEVRAKEAAETAAIEAALQPTAPLADCLQLTHYSKEVGLRERAGEALGRRPNLVAELSAEIRSEDFATRERALRAVPFLKPMPAGLKIPLEEVGNQILAELKVFNASKPEDDPRYQAAADISLHFSGWWQALIALHQHAGVDGAPQMQAMLDLASVRKDSAVLQSDVTRVARYYLDEWSSAPAVKR